MYQRSAVSRITVMLVQGCDSDSTEIADFEVVIGEESAQADGEGVGVNFPNFEDGGVDDGFIEWLSGSGS